MGQSEHSAEEVFRTGTVGTTANDDEASANLSNGAFNGKVARSREKLMLVAGVEGRTCTTARGSEIALKGLKNKVDYAR